MILCHTFVLTAAFVFSLMVAYCLTWIGPDNVWVFMGSQNAFCSGICWVRAKSVSHSYKTALLIADGLQRV